MLRIAVLAFFLLAAPAAAKPGDLDRSFADGGRIAYAAGPGYSEAGAVLLDAAGRPRVIGTAAVAPSYAVGVVATRLTPAGAIDAGFQATGFVDRPASAGPPVAVALPGGGMIAASLFSRPDATSIDVFRLGADGVDAAFGPVVVALPQTALSLAGVGVDRTGRITVAATAYPGNDLSRPRILIARVTPGGVLERTTVLPDRLRAGALLVQPDGTAIVAGYARSLHEAPGHVRVLVLDPADRRRDGADFALHSRHESEDAGPVALARGPRGTILLAGNDSRHFDENAWPWIARLRADGRLDRRFTRRRPLGTRVRIWVRAMARDHHGRIVLAGSRRNERVIGLQAAALRLSPQGRLDRRFGLVVKQLGRLRNRTLVASAAKAVAIDARDRVVIAGVAYDDGVEIREDVGLSYFAVARLRG